MAELLDTLLTPNSLEMRYRFQASPRQLFDAWTQPELLRQWFRVHPDYTTPTAEVDLRVGGPFRLAMRSPEGENIVAFGEYREVQPPSRLFFTWQWESAPPESPPTLVSLDFRAMDSVTEIVLLHEHFVSEEQRDNHLEGWQGCIDNLFASLA